MKTIRTVSLFKTLFLAVAAMGISAIPVHAQTTVGSFSLVHRVYWGGAVLAPGNYTFSLDSEVSPARLMVRQASGSMVAILLPQAISDDSVQGDSSLVLREEGGESVVSTLRLKSIGMTLQFAEPKRLMPAAETAGLGPIADSQPAK